MDRVELQIENKLFSGWKSARVTRSMETASGRFEISYIESHLDQYAKIKPESECTLLLNGTTMITGYIDTRNLSYGPEEESLSVTGKDKTAALVECSAMLDKWEFRNVDVLAFARRVCEPFGIEVKLQVRLGQEEIKPVPKLSIDPGDTAFEAIERACRAAGLLITSDGAGALVLARPGTSRAKDALVQGQNIIAASATFDATGRYRTYAVLGQQRGSDTVNSSSAAHVKAAAEDEGVKRASRTLLVIAEGNVTIAQANKRAQWERTVRRARTNVVTITVTGWTQTNGKIWPINALVSVKSPRLSLPEVDMMIAETTFELSVDGGSTTTLRCVPPDAFTLEPPELEPAGPGVAPWNELRNL